MNPKDFFADTWSLVQSNWLNILIWTGVALGLIAAIWFYRSYMSKSFKIPSLPNFFKRKNAILAELPPFDKTLKPIHDKSILILASHDPKGTCIVRNVASGSLSYRPYFKFMADFKQNPHLAPIAAFRLKKGFLTTYDDKFILASQPNLSVHLKPIALAQPADTWTPIYNTFKSQHGFLVLNGEVGEPVKVQKAHPI